MRFSVDNATLKPAVLPWIETESVLPLPSSGTSQVLFSVDFTDTLDCRPCEDAPQGTGTSGRRRLRRASFRLARPFRTS
jgi:hypothetical protein